MRIKDFKQFNIRGDQRDQIPFIRPFQFCRRQFPQGAEDLRTDQRQQAEGYRMITSLFTIP